jgi:uncharacterized Zn-finger protein
MSHQIHSKKPSLPSIQFLLNDGIRTENTSTEPVINPQASPASTNVNNYRRHRQSASISSLPSELQQLSLSAPAYNNYDIPERSENQQPSWMMMPPTSTSSTVHRKPPGASHTRSVSDFSLVNPLAVHPLPPAPIKPSRHRHQTHRRTVSANTTSNTLDFFKMVHNPKSLPYIDEDNQPPQEYYIRARTDSPPTTDTNKLTNSPQQQMLFDALNISHHGNHHPTVFLNEDGMVEDHKKKQRFPLPSKQKEETSRSETDNFMVARDEQTGRYYCPFCNKAFNRPSSLRIHTYSHTGEKPFVCQEEGCGRQFSVQSNMRRHLRVHRLGRSKTNK